MARQMLRIILCIIVLLLMGSFSLTADGDMAVNGNVGIGASNPGDKLDVPGGSVILPYLNWLKLRSSGEAPGRFWEQQMQRSCGKSTKTFEMFCKMLASGHQDSGQPRRAASLLPHPASALSALGPVSSGFILYQDSIILPSSSIKNDERIIPSVFLPYIIFSPQAPYALATERSGSESKGNCRWYFSSNFFCVAGGSGLIAATTTPFLANSGCASRTLWAWAVHPEVLALG